MAISRLTFERNPEISLAEKFGQINWGLVFVITLIAAIGCAMLYSAAEGSIDPWASRQAVRFGAGLLLMFAVALIDVRIWFRYAYAFYFGKEVTEVFPSYLTLEMTNRCNLDCVMCPRAQQTRPVGDLEIDLLEKILKEADGRLEILDIIHKNGFAID